MTRIVFYDGVCGLCNRMVQWVIAHDHGGVFAYAPLQGTTAAQCLPPLDADPQGWSMVLLEDGHAHRRSDAVVRLLIALGGRWAVVGRALQLIPRPIRDAGYRFIARRRYGWFGQSDVCQLPAGVKAGRLLP